MADIDKIKGSFHCDTNEEYVVLSGNKLHIFRSDGSLVATRKDIPRPGRITFLSGNRLLLCSSKDVFYMIDLRDGSDLWTAPYTKNYFNLNDLAISPDEAYAYTYDEWRGRNFISRLDLHTQTVYSHDLETDTGATCGIICDEGGVPCLLKTLMEVVGGQDVAQNGVRLHDYHSISPGGTTFWKTKWSCSPGESAVSFFNSANAVITANLHIYEPATGVSIDLLENEDTWHPTQALRDCRPDGSGRYLYLRYQTVHVIIDIAARRVAAQYAADFQRGCLLGSEYWICVNDRIIRKPFPAFEAAPAVKSSMNMDWFYAKRPELW